MTEIEINVRPSYKAVFTSSLDELSGCVKACTNAKKLLILTDDNVGRLYLDEVLSKLENKFNCFTMSIKSGEDSKSTKTYLEVIDALAENGFKRGDALLALGGGVVGDLGGFAAATYMRGIDLIQVPTSLLAMIDSSIGGKTAVNLDKGKNLLGAFYEPRLVYANVSFLKTLPQREYLSGLGEGVKYAVLSREIYDVLHDGLNEENMPEFIRACVKYKANIVENDEKEKGLRKLLNLGHTVGHAIEKAENFGFSHGECVALGLKVMCIAAKEHGELSASDYDKIARLLTPFDRKLNLTVGDVKGYIATDKKACDDEKISVVKVKGIGDCVIKNVTFNAFEDYVKNALSSLNG